MTTYEGPTTAAGPGSFAPPVKPPPVRPVDAALDEPSSDALITHVQVDPPDWRRSYLTPWQRDMMMSIASLPDGYAVREVPLILQVMADTGLIEVSEGDEFRVVVLTDAGRGALRRGWYTPC